MNCKPGDLAVFVRSSAGNEGKIVRVVRLHKRQATIGPGNVLRPGIVWLIEPKMPAWDGSLSAGAHDSNLRPIRDNDGEDETLQWAGKPESMNA